MTEETTVQLLRQARGQDRVALDALLGHVWPRIEQWVRRERGEAIRQRYETMDCAQDVGLDLVRYLPNVQIDDRETFHRILYRMIQNSLRNKYDYLMARRRRLTMERPLAIDTEIDLDPLDPKEGPLAAVSRAEMQAWIRFTLALLPPDDQELIFRRQYDGEAFADIAVALGIDPDAARMRFNRVLVKLNGLIRKLQQGEARGLFSEEQVPGLD